MFYSCSMKSPALSNQGNIEGPRPKLRGKNLNPCSDLHHRSEKTLPDIFSDAKT